MGKAWCGVVVLGLLMTLSIAAQGGAPSHREAAPTSPHGDPYLECETGTWQSPINLDMPLYIDTHDDLVFRYKPLNMRVVHDGHSVQMVHHADSVVHWKGRSYQLLQLHFHDPSEHLLEGVPYPMEMHLVHKDAQGHVLVIGVFLKLGSENQELAKAGAWIKQRLGHRLPEEGEEVSGRLIMDVTHLLPADTSHYYEYEGSLTTPPCTEGVQWVVLKEPIEISERQVDRFVRAYGPTARAAQPLHGRQVKEH